MSNPVHIDHRVHNVWKHLYTKPDDEDWQTFADSVRLYLPCGDGAIVACEDRHEPRVWWIDAWNDGRRFPFRDRLHHFIAACAMAGCAELRAYTGDRPTRIYLLDGWSEIAENTYALGLKIDG